MNLFPAFLDVARRPCLVVGGGRVGLAGTRSLVAAEAAGVLCCSGDHEKAEAFVEQTFASAGDATETGEGRCTR